MTSDRKLSIRKTPALGPTEITEIVYSGGRLPSDEELARLNAIPAPVYVLDETVDLVGADDETTELPVIELPERYEDRYPLMALPRRMLAAYEESERVRARVAAAKKGLLNLGRLTIEELPLLFPGDQVFVRREVRGPVREWLVAFLIRVVTFTRKDKRPTVFEHVATVIRIVREIDALTSTGELISSGPAVDYVLCEALGKGGVQLRRLLIAYGSARDYSIAIARHRLATQEHRSKIVRAELSLVGRPYGYAKIGAHLADYGLTRLWNLAGGPGDVYAFRWLCRMERYPMCSWKSLYSYRKGGLRFSTGLSTGSPDDLADECLRKTPTIWSWPFISPTIRDELLGSATGDDEGRTK